MTIGRVESPGNQPFQKDLGMVAVQDRPSGLKIWTEYPNTFVEVVEAAYTEQVPCTLLPQSTIDLRRVDGERGDPYVTPPDSLTVSFRRGRRLEIFAGIRTKDRRIQHARPFANIVLSNPTEVKAQLLNKNKPEQPPLF